ncbi:L,D-transpeptidase [Sphingobacterium paludis]|uniref:Lipoprotein-anchoring transpeptidase ErfK/SrfK n=1 Tax=Sphingobacterium paludis TaxID=1476465 RepID=A0A4R7CXG2_9SPHI|nr:L,D-transpeptidase [Sphingobacterium paludis]TDS13219.1 lipoprotein-anchoring transpeptidase ErfK/SrfK [Sphingobacterium paludis]
MKLYSKLVFLACSLAVIACNQPNTTKNEKTDPAEQRRLDSLDAVKKAEEEAKKKPRTAEDIKLSKELSYDKHTLEDSYSYKDTSRVFQLDKIKERLAFVENFQRAPASYVVLQNHKNKNQEAPLVKKYRRNEYTRISDTLGNERYQSAPLYVPGETERPTVYGRDGFLAKLRSSDTLDMVKVEGVSFEGTWEAPKRYVKALGDSVDFHHVVFVDVTNQNIMTVERTGDCDWVIRSMNPATTGRHKPPYAQETPTGVYVVQEKKTKMYYYKDGTTNIEGYAPYASRFTNGAYVHGVPVNNPKGSIIEYSWSLGTTPRSHMCVRNASSHAKFVFDWAKKFNALVIVID